MTIAERYIKAINRQCVSDKEDTTVCLTVFSHMVLALETHLKAYTETTRRNYSGSTTFKRVNYFEFKDGSGLFMDSEFTNNYLNECFERPRLTE